MYRYDRIRPGSFDERVAQFRDQIARWKAGELDRRRTAPAAPAERPLHPAPCADVPASPFPMACSLCASCANRRTRAAYDRGYGHFTTRHNMQFNWPKIEDVPEMLAELAKVEMHAIQTSGNCIRNVTTDQFAGVAAGEIRSAPAVRDPAPVEHLPSGIRLPAAQVQDCREWRAGGPRRDLVPRYRPAILKTDDGMIGFRVIVGGGLGRTPIKGEVVREFLPWQDILTYSEAILRVYNRYGRRDNAYKARIKILVQAPGRVRTPGGCRRAPCAGGPATITQAEYDRVAACFEPPA